MKVTNQFNVPLAMAVWLVTDDYDYVNDPKYISATTLLKPIREIVLKKRVDSTDLEMDVSDLISRSFGTCVHDSIEKAWQNNYVKALRFLGYEDDVISRVVINPSKEQLAKMDDPIPVYIEQRATRKIMGFTIGGKFDMIAEGILHDNKSTSAWTWVFDDKSGDYTKQGSIYRWLNPDKIDEDVIRINYVFTDWTKSDAGKEIGGEGSGKFYPDNRIKYREYPLMSLAQTEEWIRSKLTQVQKYMDADEADIPECTEDELWWKPPSYAYYANPEKMGRATKRFTGPTAQADVLAYHKSAKGKPNGIIITTPGEAKRCQYCSAAPACKQKDKYIND